MPKKLAPKTQPLSLERVISLYLSHCRSKDLSENTVAFYGLRLGYFRTWLTQLLRQEPTLDDFTTEHFQGFILEKQSGGLYQDHAFHEPQEKRPSSSYIHGFFRTMKAFGGFLERQGFATENPMRRLELPKLKDKELRPLTAEEEKKLLDTYNENVPSGCRTKAILMLMLDAGLRKGEVVDLKFADVHLEEGYLLVKGKGSKERWLPFGHKTGWILQRYATLYRPEPFANADGFFLDPQGNNITLNAMRMMFVRISRKTGIERLHPHLTRHTFGIRSEELGVPTLTLQHLMGHTDVRTTQRYAHAAESEKIKTERGYSHLDQLPVKVKKAPKVK